jgi:hypothetical protein
LIRGNFKIDPDHLSDEEYGMLTGEAMWLEQMRVKLIAAEIAAMFGAS